MAALKVYCVGGLMAVGVAAVSYGCVVRFDGGTSRVTAREERRFSVDGVPELTLATFDGSIEIRAWDRPEIVVELEKRGADQAALDSIEIRSDQDGRRVVVEARRPERGGGAVRFGLRQASSARLLASVPRETNLLARSGDGSITIERVRGRLELRTGDGSIRGDDLAGDVTAHTGDGSVKLSGLDGSVDVDTGDGGVAVEGRLHAARVRTGDGSVRVRLRQDSVMSDDWVITTGDGAVVVEIPEGFAAELDAHTGDGAVRADDAIGLVLSEATNRRSARGTIGGGGRTLRVRSGDGSITLRRF
jgi:hypothetical protein